MVFLLSSNSFNNSSNAEICLNNNNITLEQYGFTICYEDLNKIELENQIVLTDLDTALLPKLTEYKDSDFTTRLEDNYMALIIEKKGITLYRDIFGSRPIYYVEKKGEIAISDRIKPLIQFYNQANLNRNVALDYLHTGRVDHRRETFFKNVKRLKPREAIKFSKNKLKVFRPDYTLRDSRNIDETVREEIRRKLPEEKFICPISGGLDSSIVASMSANKNAEFVHVSFDKKTGDERFFRLVEEKYGIDVEIFKFSVDRLFHGISESLEHQEEPTGMLAVQAQDQFYRKLQEEKGDSILVHGSAADEFFYGYPKFIPYYIREKLAKGVIEGMSAFLKYRSQLNSFQKREVIRLVTGGLYKPQNPRISHYCVEDLSYERPESLEEARKTHLESFSFPHILRSISKNSKKHSHEAKAAFLSKSIKLKTDNINPLSHFGSGRNKKVLRDIFREDLPQPIYQRKKKTGFIHTDNRYYTPSILQELETTFESREFQSRKLYDSNKILSKLKKNQLNFWEAYRYYTFEKWVKRYIDSLS